MLDFKKNTEQSDTDHEDVGIKNFEEKESQSDDLESSLTSSSEPHLEKLEFESEKEETLHITEEGAEESKDDSLDTDLKLSLDKEDQDNELSTEEDGKTEIDVPLLVSTEEEKVTKKKRKGDAPNSKEKFSFFSKTFALIIVLLCVALMTAPSFLGKRDLWQNEIEIASSVKYTYEHADILAPLIDNNMYLEEYPLPTWLLFALNTAKDTAESTLNTFVDISSLEEDHIVFALSAFSLFLFALSIYMLAVATYCSSRVALGSVCIALVSIFAINIELFPFAILLFAGLINIALALLFRSWMKKFTLIELLCAFLLITIAFFSGGVFAVFIPMLASILFLTLRGNFSRLNVFDGVFGALCLALILGTMFFLFSVENHHAYVAERIDIEAYQQSWANWNVLHNTLLFIVGFLVLLFPFSLILFFINWFGVLASLPKTFKNARLSTRRELEIDRLARKKAGEKRAKIDPLKLAECQQATGNLYLYSLIFVHMLLLICYPNLTEFAFTYPAAFEVIAVSGKSFTAFLLPALPVMSILFAKSIMSFGPYRSRFFFSIIGLLILTIGVGLLLFTMLPEISALKLAWLDFVPQKFLDIALTLDTEAFFAMSIGLIVLALLLFLTKKAYPQRPLYTLTFGMLALVWLVHFMLFPTLNPYLSSKPIAQIIDTNANEFTPLAMSAKSQVYYYTDAEIKAYPSFEAFVSAVEQEEKALLILSDEELLEWNARGLEEDEKIEVIQLGKTFLPLHLLKFTQDKPQPIIEEVPAELPSDVPSVFGAIIEGESSDSSLEDALSEENIVETESLDAEDFVEPALEENENTETEEFSPEIPDAQSQDNENSSVEM